MPSRKLTPRDINALLKYAAENNPVLKYSGGKFPFPIQQKLLNCDAPEILFGGAAGGSKTVGLWFKALQHVDNPHYHCLILRKTYQDLSLPGSLIDIAKESLKNTDAVYNGSQHQCQFPSGAVIAFGYLEGIGDCYRYKSAEFSTIIIDEASEILESNLKYMHSRLRTTKESGLKTQYILATNPGGPSHEYIYDRYVNPKTRIPEAAFIPALYSDNKSLNAEEYEANLKKLTDIEYRQLAKGEWILDDSNLIYHYNENNNLLGKTYFLPEMHYKVMGIDLGYNDDSAITIVGWNKNKPYLYVLYSQSWKNLNVTDLCSLVKPLYDQHLPQSVVVDAAGPGKMISQELIRRYDIPAKSANKVEKENYIKLINADFEHSIVKIFPVQCMDLVKELTSLDKDKHGKENPAKDNHCCDSLLYAYKEARHFWSKPEPNQQELEDEWTRKLRQPPDPDRIENLL